MEIFEKQYWGMVVGESGKGDASVVRLRRPIGGDSQRPVGEPREEGTQRKGGEHQWRNRRTEGEKQEHY